MQRRSGLTLWSIADVDQGLVPAADAAVFEAIVGWTRSFLLAGHPQLGRDGLVCPFTKAALENGLFLLACAEPSSDTREIQVLISRFRAWYCEMAAKLDDRKRGLLTFLVLLPDLDPTDASELDAVQAVLKDEFVEQGLMIGQFHPACNQPGIWNANFRPLRAPVPLLAIRAMVKQDLPFLVDQPSHVEAYRRRFGHRTPAAQSRVRALFNERETQLGDDARIGA
ncbi:MAG TPA: hypothetical protein VE591_04680 [Candidatus Acidoferrum sp.]|nr:hypothetical protein [Candidatus Acidoferrum sp.]